jgi:hypothetical protein
MCATCPWRAGSPYASLKSYLEESSYRETRICHSTGSNAINHKTGKPELACRGSRNVQLQLFTAMGFLSTPTDAAWEAKCRELELT